MTIDRDAGTDAGPGCPHEEIVQFIYRTATAAPLLQRARALLAAAPAELSESFEQAVRGAGMAS